MEPEKWINYESVSPEKGMFRTPRFYGYFVVYVGPIKHMELTVNATYTKHMIVKHFKLHTRG
jgi:hypothetical protein